LRRHSASVALRRRNILASQSGMCRVLLLGLFSLVEQ
jgi:hypothetical protein